MNILVTGANGQLGKSIMEVKNKIGFTYNHNFYFFGKDNLDITNESDVEKIVSDKKIDIVINCAAWTNCEGAEDASNYHIVNEINAKAPLILANICKQNKSLLIHISTDYVFDGRKIGFYTEEDKTNPISTYGKTKLEGENNVINSGCNYIIIRTSGLYSLSDNSFFYKIMKKIENGEDAKVVNDIYTTPTCSYNLAFFILSLLENESIKTLKEIIHYSDGEVMSWYDFAKEIEELIMSKDKGKVIPINSNAYKTKVNRPFYSALSIEKAKKMAYYPFVSHKEWVKFLMKMKNKKG